MLRTLNLAAAVMVPAGVALLAYADDKAADSFGRTVLAGAMPFLATLLAFKFPSIRFLRVSGVIANFIGALGFAGVATLAWTQTSMLFSLLPLLTLAALLCAWNVRALLVARGRW